MAVVGALESFLGGDGVESRFPESAGGGGGVIDFCACDELEGCDFGDWCHCWFFRVYGWFLMSVVEDLGQLSGIDSNIAFLAHLAAEVAVTSLGHRSPRSSFQGPIGLWF